MNEADKKFLKDRFKAIWAIASEFSPDNPHAVMPYLIEIDRSGYFWEISSSLQDIAKALEKRNDIS